MNHCFYRIAGLLLRVSIPKDWMYRDQGYLAPFLAEPGEADHFFEFHPVDCLTPPEGDCLYAKPDRRVYGVDSQRFTYIGSVADSLTGAYLRISRRGNTSHIEFLTGQMPCGLTAGVVMKALELEHLTARNRSFLLHASFIRWRDCGILFTAPSGTGKSTQAKLWCDLCDAELINGDRAIVRLVDEKVLACGVPFCGSSGVTKNAELPLAAIVCLSQAPSTWIRPTRGFSAFRRMWEGCSVNVWDREDADLCSRTILDVLKIVPAYHLACTPDRSAVSALWSVLIKE